jgi:hypothetical protein
VLKNGWNRKWHWFRKSSAVRFVAVVVVVLMIVFVVAVVAAEFDDT